MTNKIFICPICKEDVECQSKTFPFCSDRCKLIDLGNWADGSYSVPDENTPFEPSPDNSTLH
ncbi:MAG: DNA gyrase inhibitor YacG [Mariprofundaceae bacterium]